MEATRSTSTLFILSVPSGYFIFSKRVLFERIESFIILLFCEHEVNMLFSQYFKKEWGATENQIKLQIIITNTSIMYSLLAEKISQVTSIDEEGMGNCFCLT